MHAVTRDDEQSRDDMTSQFEHLSFATMSLLPNERDNKDEVFAKLDIILSNRDRRQMANLKVKVDTGAQGNILPLRIFRRMFPEKLTAEGYPSHGAVTLRSKTTLSAYKLQWLQDSTIWINITAMSIQQQRMGERRILHC